MQTGIKRLMCVVAVAGLAACASAPTHQLGESQATVRAAEAVGAQNYPKAAYHLELAKQQLAAAKMLIRNDDRSDMKAAERLLLRAQVDAELAMQMARTDEARQDAKQAWAETRELQNGGNDHGH